MLQNLTAAWAVYLSSGSQLFKPSDCTVVSHLKDATLRKEPSGRTREETARQLSLATWSCSAVPTLHQDSTCCLAGFLPCCVEQKPNFQVFMVITAIKTKTLLTALHATISCLLWINTICSLVYCKLVMISSHQSQLWSTRPSLDCLGKWFQWSTRTCQCVTRFLFSARFGGSDLGACASGRKIFAYLDANAWLAQECARKVVKCLICCLLWLIQDRT